MDHNELEIGIEEKRLEETIVLAKKQLKRAKEARENGKEAVIAAKQELRENTQHSVGGLWGNDGFEDFVALSQYVNPVMNKLAEVEVTENKIAVLEELIKSPYFARIDFKFDDEDGDDFEKIYIGRASLTDDDSYDTLVYDWRSPISVIFYRFGVGRAFYDAPGGRIEGEVSLKRQYEIENGKLEYFFDADVQVMDEFLRKMLSQNTSPKMKTIVETIQKEQDTVIRNMENDLLMVKGVAGSGKTSIALHRAAYLMYQGLSEKLSVNNIIVISPNTLFEEYISTVLPQLGEENVISLVFEEIIMKILENKKMQTRNQFLEKLITDHKFKEIMKNSIEFKTSPVFLEILNRFISDLPKRWIKFKDLYSGDELILSKEELRKKVISGRNETPLGTKLKMLEDFVLESAKEVGNGPSVKAIKNEIQTFTEINVEEFYKEFIHDRDSFYTLSEGLSLPPCIDEILNFTEENLQSDRLYYDDASVLAFLKIKISGNKEFRGIKQVVIDEAQDYYPLHYEIFNLLFFNAKYTILGDINQTLEKSENISLYEEIGRILNKKKSLVVTMNKSFRCTNELLNYSRRFIDMEMEIKSFNRQGDPPNIYSSQTQEEWADLIVSEIDLSLKKGYGSVGLICKTERNVYILFDALKEKIDISVIKNNGKSTALHGAFIIPVYMSKGLEFDSVLICDASDENYSSEDERKLLYIASTRALHRLNFFSLGQISRFIK